MTYGEDIGATKTFNQLIEDSGLTDTPKAELLESLQILAGNPVIQT